MEHESFVRAQCSCACILFPVSQPFFKALNRICNAFDRALPAENEALNFLFPVHAHHAKPSRFYPEISRVRSALAKNFI